MAIRSAGAARAILVIRGVMGRGAPRYFCDGKGRILSEEERAKETVYIQKMERERMEKMRRKAEKEKKAEAEKKAKGGEEHQAA